MVSRMKKNNNIVFDIYYRTFKIFFLHQYWVKCSFHRTANVLYCRAPVESFFKGHSSLAVRTSDTTPKAKGLRGHKACSDSTLDSTTHRHARKGAPPLHVCTETDGTDRASYKGMKIS